MRSEIQCGKKLLVDNIKFFNVKNVVCMSLYRLAEALELYRRDRTM